MLNSFKGLLCMLMLLKTEERKGESLFLCICMESVCIGNLILCLRNKLWMRWGDQLEISAEVRKINATGKSRLTSGIGLWNTEWDREWRVQHFDQFLYFKLYFNWNSALELWWIWGTLSSRTSYQHYDTGFLFRRKRNIWGLPGINLKMFKRNCHYLYRLV